MKRLLAGRLALHLAMALSLWMAWTLGRESARPPQPAPPAAAAVTTTSPVVPARLVLSASSAERLALRIAAEGPVLAQASDSSLRAILSTWAEPGLVAPLAGQIAAASGRLRVEGGESFWAAPLAVSALALDPGRERVDVLCAEVVAVGGLPTYQALTIEEMDFDATGDAWRLAVTRDRPAPVLVGLPGAVSSPPVEAAAELSGYRPIGSALWQS